MGKKKTLKIRHQTKSDDLPPILSGILKLLEVNSTSKYIIKKTKKDKRLVARDLNRLIQKGYIKRIDRGVFKILKSRKVVLPRHQKKHFRLHNLELELNITSTTHKRIKSIVMKNNQYYNVRQFGNAGKYFDMAEVTGLITKLGIFIFFPENWEVKASTRKSLINKMYDIIEKTLRKWESKFRLDLFKDGRINFNIRNMHVAYVDGPLVKEFEKKDINHLVIYDKEDGKPRFVIDMSKGFPEFEAVHPEKALHDTGSVEYWGDKVADGSFEEHHKDFERLSHDDLARSIVHIAKITGELGKIQIAHIKNDTNTNKMLLPLIQVIAAQYIPPPPSKDKTQTKIPDYIG